MARIGTIKPEFFTSEDIVSLSPLARLFTCHCGVKLTARAVWIGELAPSRCAISQAITATCRRLPMS